MKKFIHILLAAIAFAGAIQTPTHAAQVSSFYYWSDPPYSTGSYGHWIDNNHTQFEVQAWWCSPDGMTRNGNIKVWQIKNIPGATLVCISDTPFYNQIGASVTWAGGTATNSYIKVEILVSSYIAIYGEANH